MPFDSWTATGVDWTISWSPEAPHLEGTDAVVEAIEAALESHIGPIVLPTWTEVPAQVSDPRAVLAVLARAAGSDPLHLSERAPAAPGIPGGAIA